MAKRHQIRAGDWESIVGRLQELVLANSGEDEFQEIFKILVAKLYAEKFAAWGAHFGSGQSPAETAGRLNELLARAAAQWPGIIDDARSRLADDHLTICVEALADYSICSSNFEVLDGFFEFLVGRVAKGSKGQYFTPRQVVECCVRIVDPAPTETVLDPACGSAGFLVHVLNHNAARLRTSARTYCATKLWGCDFDKRAVQVAKALMLVAGDDHTNLHQLNSLAMADGRDLMDTASADAPRLTIEDLTRSKTRKFRGFDVILTNPPFAGEIREPALLNCYEVARRNRRIERDALFLERCVRLLRPGGRLGMVLPHNKLGGGSWAYLRDWLIRQVRVVAVLGLDRSAFLPHTHQKASVLFAVKRPKPVRRPVDEPVLFVLSESSGKDSRGKTRERRGAAPNHPAWYRADHDFDSVVERVAEFTRTHAVAWGPSPARGTPWRSPAEGSLPARGAPSGSPAEGSLPARGAPSRSPAEGS